VFIFSRLFTVRHIEPSTSLLLSLFRFVFYEFRLFLNTILTVAKLRMTSVHVIPLTVFYTPIACTLSRVRTIIHRPNRIEEIAFNPDSKIGCLFHVPIFFIPVPSVLRRRSAGACLLRLLVRIPPGAWVSVVGVVCYTGRSLCDELITRSDETYRLWCVVVCDA
jgi:hypothetical protein